MSEVQIRYASFRSKMDRRKVGRKIWANRWIYLMILPVVLYYILFKYWPMLWLRIAFYEPNTEAMGYPICCL